MNGLLVVDKPEGFTSFDVVAKLRGICGTKKIGHGGTLDPMATGVLPVFVGAAAKAVDLVPNQDKAYQALLRFGIATDTGDVTGEVLRQTDVLIRESELRAVLPHFTGPQMQTPPMYSAVKVNGKPLYKYAREGKDVQRRPRPVTFYELELAGTPRPNDFELTVRCSKGAYIRTLAEQLGEALGVPATLAALRRTAAGVLALKDAHGLQAIQHAKDENRLDSLMLGVDALFESLPALQLANGAAARLANGAPVYGMQGQAGQRRLYAAGTFLGLGRLNEDGELRVVKLFTSPQSV